MCLLGVITAFANLGDCIKLGLLKARVAVDDCISDMKANALTMKLNVNAGRLFNEYGISYQNKRCHDGRKVSLIYKQRDDV